MRASRCRICREGVGVNIIKRRASTSREWVRVNGCPGACCIGPMAVMKLFVVMGQLHVFQSVDGAGAQVEYRGDQCCTQAQACQYGKCQPAEAQVCLILPDRPKNIGATLAGMPLCFCYIVTIVQPEVYTLIYDPT